jgi:hypothetical protein
VHVGSSGPPHSSEVTPVLTNAPRRTRRATRIFSELASEVKPCLIGWPAIVIEDDPTLTAATDCRNRLLKHAPEDELPQAEAIAKFMRPNAQASTFATGGG